MSRVRWFYAPEYERKGPVPLDQLVQGLLALREPRGCLVWRRGLAMWTRAGEVREVEDQLAQFIAEPKPLSLPPTPVAALGALPRSDGTAASASSAEAEAALDNLDVTVPIEAEPSLLSRPASWLGAAVLFAALALGVWSMRPRTADPGARGGIATPSGRPSGGAAPAGRDGDVAPAVDQTSSEFAGWADVEADLPGAEREKLRGVAAWSGNELTITLYNGSDWRVTELFVLTSRLQNGEFVDSSLPNVLVPPAQSLDSGVADMLDRVAPDRKKPGLNPHDTGPFAGPAGVQPEAYRWMIEGARGYPPRGQ